jgi:hypothetical protein
MGFGAPQGPGINPLKQYDLASDPASVVNLGQAYWKDTGSGNEFFLEDETGNVTQVTTAGTAGLYNVFPASLYVTGGDVGVGTLTPDGKLHVMKASAGTVTASGDGNALVVEDDDVAGMTFLAPNESVIFFGDEADNDIGRIRYNHSDNSMRIWTNNAERLRVDNAGQVGIGVADPDEQLEITGRLHMGQIAAPGTTTDKLYNVSGALTWNGTDLTAGGGGISSIVTKTASYTATTDDDIILCNAATITITLYAASGNSGEVLYIKNIRAASIVTIDGDGSETIDGDLVRYIINQYEILTICCDGSNWHII